MRNCLVLVRTLRLAQLALRLAQLSHLVKFLSGDGSILRRQIG